jgi:hypothetical protein
MCAWKFIEYAFISLDDVSPSSSEGFSPLFYGYIQTVYRSRDVWSLPSELSPVEKGVGCELGSSILYREFSQP